MILSRLRICVLSILLLSIVSCKVSKLIDSESAANTMCDSRDGRIYKTVKIGTQIWMAENLAYTGSIPHVKSDDDWENYPKAYCYYNDDESHGTDGYGCLYTWNAAIDYDFNGTSSDELKEWNKKMYELTNSGSRLIRGICPLGWHLPSDMEWAELYSYAAKSMVSKTDWLISDNVEDIGNDTTTNNSCGFSAIPAGLNFPGTGFMGEENKANWWSSTFCGSLKASFFYFADREQYLGNHKFHPIMGLSVRCVMD